MRIFTQTLKFFFLACALVFAFNVMGQVTVDGTVTTTATLGGSSQYVVMAYTDGEKHTSYRTWEGISRTDVVSRNNDAPAAQLYIELKRDGGWILADQEAKIQTSTDNSSWTDISNNLDVSNTSYAMFGPYDVVRNAKYVRIISTSGTKDKYFRNVYMTMASYCQFENTNILNFGSNVYMTPNELTKKIIWSNISNKDITITGTDKDRFSVSLTKVGCSAGKWGNTIVTVTYKRDKYDGGREHTATLNVNGNSITLKGTTTVATPRIIECATASAIAYQSAISGSTLTPGTAKHPTRDLIVDGTWTWQNGSLTADAYNTYTVVFTPDAKYGDGYSTQTCTISIPVTKLDQTISWGLTEGVEYATGQLMDATASSGLPVTYTPNAPGDGVAGYINENGRLVVVVPNKEITITASQAGNENWNAADPVVTKTFTTKGANPNQFMDVEATSITYGDLLGESKFTPESKVYVDGVEIDGTLEWVDPAIMPNAGTAPHMVLFTPTNTAAYSSVYFEVSVTVAKANPVITWNISNILREEVRYDHFVTSSNKEKEFSISVSNATLLNVSGTTLRTGSIDNRVTGLTITLTQEASDNYNRKTETKTVAIYPKAGICLPFNPMDKSAYDEAMKATDGGSWCNTNDNGSEPFDSWGWGLINVTYSQRVGIKLGNWRGGFDYSTKYVDLFFSGIPDQISFDYELQTVHSPGIDWPTTAINWYLYESADDVTYTERVHRTNNSGTITYTLDENTRYVRIVYGGNFAGFIKNLRITQKKYLNADKAELTFGTETHPLQEPQAITLSYSSLGVCGGMEDAITVTSNNAAFYVDEPTITENVGIEQKGTYTIRVRCDDVNQSGTITFTSNDGTVLNIPVRSNNPTPVITNTASAIFQTGTEHATGSEPYRAQRTLLTSDVLNGLFDGSTPLFDTLYIYGVSESAASSREWEYSPAKGYKVPVVTASNVHTPCFVYKKDGSQYTYVRTFDAATKTLNVADSKTRVFVGYRPAGPATTAIQLGASAAINLNNTEIVATSAAVTVNGNATISARGANIVSSASKAAIQLAGTATLTINDSWKTAEPSAILALRPASGYPSIDLGSASGRVDINGTQLELHNAANMAIAHMDGTTEKFDGEVHINDGSIGGAETLGMPKLTFIDGGTFNDGTVVAYTLKGQPKRPRNSRGEIVSRQTMTKTALEAYDWYGQAHLTLDGSAKVNPMLPDETVWIFNGDAGEGYNNGGSWNKGSVPGETDDVLINAPMVISGGELKVKSLTINWEDKGKGIPAVTISPDGGLTVGEGGIDAIKLANPAENLVLRADQELSSATKGQTGFLRIHPESAEPMPKATVELYSTTWYNKANEAGNTTRFQCVGTPIADEGVVASTVFPTGTLLYAWNESSEKWTNSRTKELVPFKGYDLSQKLSNDGLLVTFTGTLASGDKTIDLAHTSSEKGFNLLANSYTAPISIEEFIDDDFVNASQTIYILNAGTKAESNAQAGGLDAAGKWVGIPAKTASELAAEGYPCVIPSMQGFWVQSTGAGAQLKLNYDRLVMGVTYTEPTANKPLRVAKSRETEQVGKLMINLYTETDADCVFILESDSYDAAYEDGYDARKIASETMDVFTIRDSEQLGVDATNTIEGTRVGVRTGEETTYTFRFSHIQSEKDLVLWDKETKMKVYINEDIEYTFYAVPNSEITERFQIVAANIPTITTGVDEVESETKVQKFIKDNQLYILKDGVLYNATGAVVRK